MRLVVLNIILFLVGLKTMSQSILESPEKKINPTYYPGYIVFSDQDTLYTKIAWTTRSKSIEFTDFFERVCFISKDSKPDTVYPGKNVIAFSFKKDTVDYIFHQIPLYNSDGYKQGKAYGLLVINGPLKLFYILAYTPGAIFTQLPITNPKRRPANKGTHPELNDNWTENTINHLNSRSSDIGISPYTLGYERKIIIYYFQKGNEEPVYVRKASSFRHTGKFDKDWLKMYFRKVPDLSKKIGKELSTDDLETIAREYNNIFEKSQMPDK